ncbi:MAG: SUMF1/EgtB/PvdO family nonheme iron enzyme [Sphaerochaeta sp.]|nr:SUMF1/EgtB/PvdO family nonheme iron enzyme [Sphaerochaeta sp.]MDD3056964.1 SUMF1/EgtB/PvdO family nonheme iron enzyme [Sphaerochaeta sp.]
MLEANTGSLAISLGSSSRSLVWEPELDMDIASYTIKGAGPTTNDAFEVSGHTEGLFTKDGLAVGRWTITVDGYNSDSEKIATVQATATVTRNATTSVTVVLRPLEGTGTLSVSMSWTDSQGVLASPSAVVVIRDEQGADIQDISDPVAMTINGQNATIEVTNLPTGWYEVTLSLRDGNSNAWQGVFALRVVKDQTTTGTVVIDEAQIQIGPGTGTVAITIEEDMDDPLSVGFSGMPDSVEAGTEVTLSSTGTYSGDVQYRWYVNGVRQADQTESSFSYTFDTAGTHTMSLLVLDGGALGGYGQSVVIREAEQTDEYSIPLVFVQGGTFQMGNPSGGDSDERPVHSVTIDSFYMGAYEITQDIYEQVIGSNPSNWKGARLPVETVTWYDAVAFCNALSRKDGLEEVYTISGTTVSCDWNKKGYRLPTEAEWEYAARGGKQSKGYTYAGSNTVGDVAWYSGNSGERTHEVGCKQANELGLYDMSGNVWESCWDWKEDYRATAQTNPTGPLSGSYHVLRGGSCYYLATYVRSAVRGRSTPSGRGDSNGFRLVLPAE